MSATIKLTDPAEKYIF